MKQLKAKFRNLKIKKPVEKKVTPKLGLLKIKKKQGRWCEYYEGRLPYSIECSYNKENPVLFKKPNCRNCERYVTWTSKVEGLWKNIITRIEKGEDLINEPSPLEKEGIENYL